MVAMSFVASKLEGLPEGSSMFFLIAAYACIIITLYLDLSKIRKLRKQYAAQMAAAQTKESRAEQKKRKAAQKKILMRLSQRALWIKQKVSLNLKNRRLLCCLFPGM